jgi:HlyD family secretion protein
VSVTGAIKSRRGIALAAVLLLAALGVAMFRAADGESPRDTEAEPATVASAPGWVDVEGGLRRLGVPGAATVQAVVANEGDAVDAGVVLLKLDDREAAIDARIAEIELQRESREHAALLDGLERNRRAAERLKPLVAEQAESADELRDASARIADLESRVELARLAAEAARLRSELAREKLARHELRAPSKGVVIRVLAQPGDVVAPGSPLLWFGAEGSRIVRAELDERLFGRVAPGMKARVSPEYDDRKIYPARVLRVSQAVGPVTALPEVKPAAKDDRVVELVLELDAKDLLIGQRVLVRVLDGS